jgi:hypothetical protein
LVSNKARGMVGRGWLGAPWGLMTPEIIDIVAPDQFRFHDVLYRFDGRSDFSNCIDCKVGMCMYSP